MIRMFATTLLAASAVIAISALAFAEETTVIEKRVETQQNNAVVQHEVVVPQPQVEKKVVERTVTTEQPVVQKRTDTVVTHEERTED